MGIRFYIRIVYGITVRDDYVYVGYFGADMKQNKFKFGDKVKTKYRATFTIERIAFDKLSGCFFYNSNNCPFEPVPESQLEEVVEPMTAEFDAFVYECPNDCYFGMISEKELKNFYGKNVHVKVTEIL